jgi:hyaluronan synthase
MRYVTMFGIISVIVFNIIYGLAYSDPLIIYSTLIPIHAVLVFAVGWIFFKIKPRGEIGTNLVSVIVPVYNQESMIEIVIDSIFKSTYENIEVIAVNDGSKDGTKKILDLLATRYRNLTVIHKNNEGKRKAVATGFYKSKGRFIVLMDSDSVVDRRAISEFMRVFNANPKVGGVVGNAKVWNSSHNFLTKCQDVWYDYAFNIHKTCESYFGSVLCCSGCLAGYRREAIESFIPYWIKARIHNSDDRDLTSFTIAPSWARKDLAPVSNNLMRSMAGFDDSEDRGLTAVTIKEWEAVYVPSAVAYTEVPEKIKNYLRQQTRWKKGYLRSNFFVSAFFWKKNPIMSLIFYTEFMTTFTSPLVLFIVYFYEPFLMNHYIIPIVYFIGQILVGLAAGLDYRFRDPNARNWRYKPVMNLIASFILSWLIIPAIWTYRKNQWLTR